MVEDKKEKKQKNKGVNANPGRALKQNVYFSDTDSCSLSLGPIKSIARVKSDLQTVIDLMGPSTPQFLRSSSNDGDNELSATSDTTKNNKSSINSKEDEESQIYSQNTTDKTMPPDITLQEDADYSMVADKNSTTLDVQEVPQYICPPPLMPANMVYNSECMCPQIANFINKGAASMPCMGGSQKEGKKLGRHKNFLYNIFKHLTEKSHDYVPENCEYYRMNIKESQSANSPPRRLIFDLVGDVPRNNNYRPEDDLYDPYFNQTYQGPRTKAFKNLNNEQLINKETQQDEMPPSRRESTRTLDRGSRKCNQRSAYAESNVATRVDVYYFDRGDADYLKTTDSPPVVTTENLAEKTEAYTTRFWAEIFGTLHIGVSFGISFILQLFRFFLYSLLRPLTVGVVQLGTDYFLKPCITTFFNAVVQPPMIFLFNVSKSLRDICHPLAEGMGYFLRELVNVVKAFRIVDFRRDKKESLENGSEEKKNEKVEEEKTELVA